MNAFNQPDFYKVKKRISDDYANSYFIRAGQTADINVCHEVVGEVLNALAQELEDHYPHWFGQFNAGNLRAIANAKPDPLDALSWESRLGYEAAKAAKGRKFADEIYLVEVGLFTTAELCHQYNAAAQAAIQYAQDHGGDK